MSTTALISAVALGTVVLAAGPVGRHPNGPRARPAPPRWRPLSSPRALGLAAAGATVLAGIAVASPLVAGPVAAVVAASGWVVELAEQRRRDRRRQGEVTVLVDGIGRSLRSGATLSGALVEAGGDAGLVLLRPELDQVRAQIDTGRPFAVAIDDWSRRSDDPDLRLLAGTVAVLASTGGSAGPALDAVARTIRARAAVAAEVRALASQATASAAVLVAAPAVFAVVLASVDPRLGRFLVHHPAGASCVAASLVLDGLALRWMQRIIDGSTR